MEFETFEKIVWAFTTLVCAFVIGWHVADLVKFRKNLNRNGK